MRIIAGAARGRALVAPKGDKTRPTADRVREALFSILAARVHGARVFDPFAGSGAMALEALSRGAREAVLSDISRAACACARKNADACGLSARVRIVQGDWRRALPGETEPFDLAFIDPPYAMEAAYGSVLAALRTQNLFAEGAAAVLECARGADIPLPALFEVYDERRYGDTRLLFVRAKGESL